MIHKNDLRFGNIVKSRSRNEIITIDTFDTFKRVSRLSVTHEYVPLTEEWLLKFGAKELKAKRGVLKEFVLKTVRIELSNSYNFYYKNSKIIIESVSQLQNLYHALTGQELTIKP